MCDDRDIERLFLTLSKFERCPIFGHTDGTRNRRIDCSDDQCINARHIRYVECQHPSHDAVEVLETVSQRNKHEESV